MTTFIFLTIHLLVSSIDSETNFIVKLSNDMFWFTVGQYDSWKTQPFKKTKFDKKSFVSLTKPALKI